MILFINADAFIETNHITSGFWGPVPDPANPGTKTEGVHVNFIGGDFVELTKGQGAEVIFQTIRKMGKNTGDKP